MRTDSFSREKHLPVRRFIADESKVATGLYGPCAIADDLDNLCAMFDPEADILNGEQKGGIGEKNLQNGAVTIDKLSADLKEQFAGFPSPEELEQKLTEKADKAVTLSGYGITDAYTRSELDEKLSGIQTSVEKALQETILFEAVADAPVWTNQPTVSGDVSCFSSDAYYYVTLQDTEGNALPANQFMLKDLYTETVAKYAPVFTLQSLHTGTETLQENDPVEFVFSTDGFQMRDAGIVLYEQKMENFGLNDGTGSIRITVYGEVIPKTSNLYCYSHFKTDKSVSSYHSTNGTTAFQNDSTMDIVAYTAMAELSNAGNMLYDDTVLKKEGSGYFSVERNAVIRYNNKNAKAYQVIGFGKAAAHNTRLSSIAFRLNNTNNGTFRNGTRFIISEVK